MALVGSGFLAILTDVEEGANAAFADWADRVFLPAYLAIPGVLSVRRFFARRAPQKHFLLIEADQIDQIASPACLALDLAATGAVADMLPRLRNSRRLILECTASYGFGRSGALALIRVKPPHPERILGARLSIAQVLREAAHTGGLNAAHLLEADPGVSARQLPGALAWPGPADEWLLLVEGGNEAVLADTIGEKISGPDLRLIGFPMVDRPGFYRLGMDLPRAEAADALAS